MMVATAPTTVLATLSLDAAHLVHGGDGATAYSYTVEGSGTNTPSLLIDLTAETPYSYTDCNGWVNFALNSVTPLHFAVAAASRLSSLFNTAASAGSGLVLKEADEPFARAFVLAHDFATEPDVNSGTRTDGYSQVTNFGSLQAGDIIAWAIGDYADPSNTGLPKTNDTGHVMIVTGAAVSLGLGVDPTVSTIGGDDPVANIYAVSVVDSSDVAHMQQNTTGTGIDDRPLREGITKYEYALSVKDRQNAPAGSDPKAGGLGTGTLYFAVDASGKAIGFKFNEHGSWNSAQTKGQDQQNGLLLAAARLDQSIDLSLLPASAFNDRGQLEVMLMSNRDTALAGTETETISGQHGLFVTGSGLLTLHAANPNFSGGIELHGVGLELAAAGAAGTSPITTDAGTSNTIRIEAGSANVTAHGADTITAASGGSVISGGTALHFIGYGASTIGGGSGSATIEGGAGGLYQGGTAGNNIIRSEGASTLVGGGAGDQLFGGTGDRIFAANGNTTLFGGTNDILVDRDQSFAFTGQQAVLFGAETGNADVVVGTGEFLLVGRGGATTVFGGASENVTWAGASHLTDVAGTGAGTMVVGSSDADLWINGVAGAQTVLAVAGSSGGTGTILGFRPGTDHFAAAGYGGASSQIVSNGSLTVSLSDHTTITFVGVTTLG